MWILLLFILNVYFVICNLLFKVFLLFIIFNVHFVIIYFKCVTPHGVYFVIYYFKCVFCYLLF